MSFQEPQQGSAPSPCAKGCGFFGSPATQNMCSVCFKKHLVATAEPKAATSTAAADVAPSAVKTTGVDAAVAGAEKADPEEAQVALLTDEEQRRKAWAERCRAAVAENYFGNRCTHCLKKMTLVGRFKCRCGRTFCPTHRHSEAHAVPTTTSAPASSPSSATTRSSRETSCVTGSELRLMKGFVKF